MRVGSFGSQPQKAGHLVARAWDPSGVTWRTRNRCSSSPPAAMALPLAQRVGAWSAAIAAFGAWWYYDKTHPKVRSRCGVGVALQRRGPRWARGRATDIHIYSLLA